MPKTNVAVTFNEELAEALDRFVAGRPLTDRTEAMEAALTEKIVRRALVLLAYERPKVDPKTGDLLITNQLPCR